MDDLYAYLSTTEDFDQYGVNKTTMEAIAEELLENIPDTIDVRERERQAGRQADRQIDRVAAAV